MTLKTTALFEEHQNLNAKFAPFAGFNMPLQYSSVKEEVIAVRQNVGVFDVSHMGEFFIEGPDAVKFVDYLLPNNFADAGDLKAVYSPLLRDNGTMIDDLIAYKVDKEKVLICVNASNIEKDWNWIKSIFEREDFDCQLTDQSADFSLLAIQGPKSEQLLKKLLFLNDLSFPYFSVKTVDFNNELIIISRTGYTGEDGFEIFTSGQTAKELWKTFINNQVTPCGLVARDVLRLEVCFPLYGNELSDHLTPLDSALKWTVKLDKLAFVGKNALMEIKPKYRLVKLSLDRGIPRAGYSVFDKDNQKIGQITSGTMSPTINRGISLALIERDKIPVDNIYFIEIRNKLYKAEQQIKPFIRGGHK